MLAGHEAAAGRVQEAAGVEGQRVLYRGTRLEQFLLHDVGALSGKIGANLVTLDLSETSQSSPFF